MSDSPSRQNSTCPITFALDIFGDKWSLIILRDMFFKGKRYYSEFLSSPERISTNILADRLRKLETEGLISKTRDIQKRSMFVYRLTAKGEDLLPMMLEMITWSVKYDPQPDMPDNIITGAPRDLLHRWQQDRADLVAEILANIK